MWKIVFNNTQTARVIDKEGTVLYPDEWGAGYSSVVDSLIGADMLVKVEVNKAPEMRATQDPAIMLVSDRVDELNAEIEAAKADSKAETDDSGGKKTAQKTDNTPKTKK